MSNVKQALRKALELGLESSDYIEIRSEEGVEYRGKDITKALDAIMNLENCGVNFVENDGYYVGWMGVQPYEDAPEDAIYDYDDNNVMNGLMETLRQAGVLK